MTHIHIHIYIYIYIERERERDLERERERETRPKFGPEQGGTEAGCRSIRPISLHRLSLLTLLDSNFPGNPLWT